jgi:hypothetical protein
MSSLLPTPLERGASRCSAPLVQWSLSSPVESPSGTTMVDSSTTTPVAPVLAAMRTVSEPTNLPAQLEWEATIKPQVAAPFCPSPISAAPWNPALLYGGPLSSPVSGASPLPPLRSRVGPDALRLNLPSHQVLRVPNSDLQALAQVLKDFHKDLYCRYSL